MMLTPTRTGTFEALCAELCGLAHYAMRGGVIVEEEDAYQAWLDEQSTFADLMAAAGSDASDGTKLVLNKTAAPLDSGAAQ